MHLATPLCINMCALFHSHRPFILITKNYNEKSHFNVPSIVFAPFCLQRTLIVLTKVMKEVIKWTREFRMWKISSIPFGWCHWIDEYPSQLNCFGWNGFWSGKNVVLLAMKQVQRFRQHNIQSRNNNEFNSTILWNNLLSSHIHFVSIKSMFFVSLIPNSSFS